jgi:hypothetical protein
MSINIYNSKCPPAFTTFTTIFRSKTYSNYIYQYIEFPVKYIMALLIVWLEIYYKEALVRQINS